MLKNSSTSSFKSFVLTAIAFVLPFVVLLYVLDFVFTRALLASNHEDISYLKRVIDGNVNADVLITGSSRALIQFDCKNIYKNANEICFNMGMNGTKFHLQLPILKAYLESNKSPDLLIQEVGIDSFNRPSDNKLIFNEEQYAPFVKNEYIYNQLSNFDNEIWKLRYLPFYDFLVFRENMYDAIDSLRGAELKNRRDENGYRPVSRKWDGAFDRYKSANPDGVIMPIEDEFVGYLREIIEVSLNSGINVILVYPPEYSENHYLVLNREEIFDIYESLAKEYKVTFIDFSDSKLSDDKNNFYNSQHMNEDAAREFSRLLGKRIENQIEATN